MAKKKMKAKPIKKEKPSNKKDISEKILMRMEGLASKMEKSGISEYVEFLRRPWRVISINFAVGIARGVGMAIGMTLVAALLIFILTKVLSGLVSLPLIGEQIAKIIEQVNQYMGEASKIQIQ